MNPYGLLIAVLICIGVGFTGFLEGKKVERSEWQAEKIAMQQANQKALTDAYTARDAEKLKSEESARIAAKEYEDEKIKLANDYAANMGVLRLRIPTNSVCGNTPAGTQATSSGQFNVSSTTSITLPELTQEHLLGLGQEADDIAAQLRALQDWVRANGMYGPEKSPGKPGST